MNVYRNRLLNVAKALRESRRPKRFDMSAYGRICGTPACALGHYAARRDLQRTFSLRFFGSGLLINGEPTREYSHEVILAHFGLSAPEARELFSATGCQDAQTPAEAADYIERFVQRKWTVELGLQRLKDSLTKATEAG